MHYFSKIFFIFLFSFSLFGISRFNTSVQVDIASDGSMEAKHVQMLDKMVREALDDSMYKVVRSGGDLAVRILVKKEGNLYHLDMYKTDHRNSAKSYSAKTSEDFDFNDYDSVDIKMTFILKKLLRNGSFKREKQEIKPTTKENLINKNYKNKEPKKEEPKKEKEGFVLKDTKVDESNTSHEQDAGVYGNSGENDVQIVHVNQHGGGHENTDNGDKTFRYGGVELLAEYKHFVNADHFKNNRLYYGASINLYTTITDSMKIDLLRFGVLFDAEDSSNVQFKASVLNFEAYQTPFLFYSLNVFGLFSSADMLFNTFSENFMIAPLGAKVGVRLPIIPQKLAIKAYGKADWVISGNLNNWEHTKKNDLAVTAGLSVDFVF